jgi:hypothetical protein
MISLAVERATLFAATSLKAMSWPEVNETVVVRADGQRGPGLND